MVPLCPLVGEVERGRGVIEGGGCEEVGRQGVGGLSRTCRGSQYVCTQNPREPDCTACSRKRMQRLAWT